MENLLSTPDFDRLPCLQKLKLEYCYEIKEIHPSLGNHTSLEYVIVSCCAKLRMFPTIVRMKKLKTLEIANCFLILEFPEIQSNMESLVSLNLGRERGRELNLGSHRLLKGILCKMHLGCLQTLYLHDIGLKDGEIPSDVGELSNLEELYLNQNDFSRLGFSLSQLTRLKRLCLSSCKRLVQLPELPSNLMVLEADRCKSLTTIGDFYKNCDWLHDVSLTYGSIITDGVRLLEFMLQVRAIESHGMVLNIEGLKIPQRFLHCLVKSWSTYTLQLPKNWYNDFSGLIMFFVLGGGRRLPHLKITMKHVKGGIMGMDFQYDDLAWEEDGGNKRTWVRYVPFELLKHTLWWNEAYGAVSFSFEYSYRCSGYGFALVPNQTGIAPTEMLTDSPPDYSCYAPTLRIEGDSTSALIISFRS